MKYFLTITMLLMLALLISCAADDEDNANLAGEGESCIATSDCKDQLICIAQKCVKNEDALDGDSLDGDTSDGDSDIADGDTNPVSDIWYDSVSGLTWQNGDAESLNLESAISYCDDLIWDDLSDWRLPTIAEFRSLIRGCPTSETGGACGVTDSCMEHNCFGESCLGCAFEEGAGYGGLYLPTELVGDFWYYWSSSVVTDINGNAWAVQSKNASVSQASVLSYIHARCVR